MADDQERGLTPRANVDLVLQRLVEQQNALTEAMLALRQEQRADKEELQIQLNDLRYRIEVVEQNRVVIEAHAEPATQQEDQITLRRILTEPLGGEFDKRLNTAIREWLKKPL